MNRTSFLLFLLLGVLSSNLLAQSTGNLSPTPKRGLGFYYDLMEVLYCIGEDKGTAIFSAVVNEEGRLNDIKTVRSFTEEADSIVIKRLKKMNFFPGRSAHKVAPTEIILAFRMERNPRYPLAFSDCDQGEGINTYFEGVPRSPNTFYFYPMMPGWEAEKNQHLGEGRNAPVEAMDKNDNIKRVNAIEDEQTVIVVKKSNQPGVKPASPTEKKSLEIDLVQEEDTPIENVDPSPDAFIQLDKEPAVLNMKEFQLQTGYPHFAYLHEIEGKVYIRMLVDEEGKVLKFIHLRDGISPFLLESGSSGMDVIELSPGLKDGKPTKCWLTIPLVYRLLN